MRIFNTLVPIRVMNPGLDWSKMESKSSDSSSAANSEEYEIITSGGVKKDVDLEPKMEGDEATLKETMSECLNDENNDKLDTSMVNENVLENENNHTIFHNISYLGATRMDEPKNERLIQGAYIYRFVNLLKLSLSLYHNFIQNISSFRNH